jgi:hypothetical protein
LCSLLFDNVGVEELCEMAEKEVPQIPTYKLLPPMYQLAARLGTSGNLNDLVFKVPFFFSLSYNVFDQLTVMLYGDE